MFRAVIGGLRPSGDGRQRRATIWRRPMPAGLLGLAHTTEAGAVVEIAEDVEEPDVAGVERHLTAEHATPGTEACRLPICSAVLAWRPTVGSEGEVASSA